MSLDYLSTLELDLIALRDEVARLRDEVARARERERQSERLIEELREAVGARDSFIATAGHELRNPMATILLAASGLSRRIATDGAGSPEWLPPRLLALERQARLFVRRATTLLDVSRISSGNLRLEPEVVDLARFLHDLIDSSSHELEQAKCTLTTAIEEPAWGSWDRVALDQIASNLLQNAIKYGAGRPIHVALSASARDGWVTLSFADHGPGICPSDQERIFARFERAVTQKRHGGFGLGLWITRTLVDASGGTIQVESTPGLGSIFTVMLPQALEPSSR